ncbi:N-acetylmuramoyl-L-alanine amidase [Candidatus Avoscillospira sp. LCP25S3_F1]|uniref:N-acetylmuramoyl-L-alanine amidase n=1 Tax=Candidatus Avoscillospira sp. LCP25S3_F1 TaxID=3438825 RepID=UPI003F9073C0
MPFLFLSPSTQDFNPYVTEGNEQLWMNRLADRMEPYLEASGINVTRNNPNGSAATSIRQSNLGTYDFHLALHSNAAPENLAGQLRGIDAYYYPGAKFGQAMAQLVVDNLKPIYPLPDKVQTRTSTAIGELRQTKAPAALIEIGYHDNVQDATWLVENLDEIAAAMSRAVCQYFGLPFLQPQGSQNGVVRTENTPMNLRGGPGTDFPVLRRVPNGTPVEILNQYNGWYVIRVGDLLGYADGRYLEVD